MRSVSVVLLLVVVVAMASESPAPEKVHYDLSNARGLFEKFITDYNKQYKDDADKEVHFRAFVKNLKEVNRLNEDPTETVTLRINQLSDFTEEEWKRFLPDFGIAKRKESKN